MSDELRFFQGVLIAIPLSAALWAAIIVGVTGW